MHKIPHERRRVHAHKRNQRAKIEQPDPLLERQKERSNHHDHAYENYVVSRNVMLRIHRTEKRLRQGVASPHAIQQPRRADLRAHARPEVCDQQRKSDNFEKRSPRSRRCVHIRQILIRKPLRRRPNQLRDINF